MSYNNPQMGDLVYYKKRIACLVAELTQISRPDRVGAIMYQLRNAANGYIHCYYELKKKGFDQQEYNRIVKRLKYVGYSEIEMKELNGGSNV